MSPAPKKLQRRTTPLPVKQPTTGSARSRSRNATVTRARLLEAAADLFSTRGYDGTSIHDIARAAGYTIGAIYRHFDSKSSILLEVVKYSIAHVPSVEPTDPTAAPNAATLLGDLVVEFALPKMARVRRLSKELHSAARNDAGAAKLLIAFYARRAHEIADLIGRASTGRAQSPHGGEAKAWILLMLMVGVTHIETIDPDLVFENAWHDELRALVTTFLDPKANIAAAATPTGKKP
jgi:AcrR family transcriptional regulator